MTNEPRHKSYGDTIDEYLALAHNELSDESVGLWSIVPAGRVSFGLAGPALDDFVRRYILTLLAHGAKPVRAAQDTQGRPFWKAQEQYGTGSSAIADAIIHEWHAAGSPDPEWDYLRFARPDMIDRSI